MLNYLRFRFLLNAAVICCLIISCNFRAAWSQAILSKPLTINIERQRLADVLNQIGKAGNFYFSYNGKVLSKDSLVSVAADHIPVGDILSRLLGGRYEWEERDNYVIITAALRRLSLVNTDMTADDDVYSVSGIVTDAGTGERLMNASVYEKHRLTATLTDEHGYFRLKFKAEDLAPISLTAAKLAYKDTTVNMLHPVKVGFRAGRDTYRHSKNKGNRWKLTASAACSFQPGKRSRASTYRIFLQHVLSRFH